MARFPRDTSKPGSASCPRRLGQQKSESPLKPSFCASALTAALLCSTLRASYNFLPLAAMLAAVRRGVVLPMTSNLRLLEGGGSSGSCGG